MPDEVGSPLPLTTDMVTRVAVVAGLRRPRLRINPKLLDVAEGIVNEPNGVVDRHRLSMDEELGDDEWRLDGR